MPSFNPGTRVFAQLPNKTIWRTAKVVEPDPNQKIEPDIVHVTFSGKSEKVRRNLRQVKLQPQRTEPSPTPAVDLTDDITPQQDTPNSLPSYTDPWDPNAPKPAPSIPSNSPELKSEPPSSPPGRTTLPPPPPPSIHSVPSSSRDWLLSNSYPNHHVNQTLPQVVRDPSLPTSSKHEFSQRLGSSRPPSVGTSPYLRPPPYHQNFGSEPPTSNAHSFHSRLSRQTPATTHIRSYPLHHAQPPQTSPSYGPLQPHQCPSGAGRPNARPPYNNSSAYPPRPLPFSSSSQVPQRNGVTLRAPDRHPFRTVDNDLPIPRTVPSRSHLRREPRHPQSAFDDDVPIPRNIARTRLSSSSHDGFSDHQGRSYPATKRPRLDHRYGMILNDQMPPPCETEATASKLSRRLAKREISRHGNHWYEGQNDACPGLLPYQHPLTHKDHSVIIAPSFSKLESIRGKLPMATSDDETNILEEVFTGLSLSSAESFLESGVEHHKPEVKVAPLAVRSSTRKKNRPKKLRALSHGENQLDRGECSPAVVAVKEQGPVNDEQDSGRPIPKVFGCFCPENGKHIPQHEDTIQCCRCSLWLHSECAGFETGDLSGIREDLREESKNFICFQCLDDRVSLQPVGKTSEQRFSQEGTVWFSSIPRITDRMRGLGITATDPWLNYIPQKDRGRDKRHWLREPLAEDDKSARLDNLERLREGVANPSVGTRERAVLDVILAKGTSAGWM